LGYKQAGGEVFQRQEMRGAVNCCNIAARYFISGVIKRGTGQSLTTQSISCPERNVGSSRCAISVPYASIPCALKRFFSIPELIASVRA
jgi:hypothetical protein